MSFKELDTGRVNAAKEADESEASTLEMNAVKKIVRENWESKLKDKGTDIDILNEHKKNMAKLMAEIDYETLLMENIAARAKHMSRGELRAYTKTIEALGMGYRQRFGADFGNLLTAGMALVSRDMQNARKHFDYFILSLSKNESAYDKLMEAEAQEMQKLDMRLQSANSGIFRFFRKKEIARLQQVIKARQAKVIKLRGRKLKYSTLANELKARVATPTAKK